MAFLHDADKMLEIGRGEARSGALNAAAVAGLMERFGIGVFLDRHGVSLPPDAMLELVNGVEVTALQGLVGVPREHWHDRLYVRLADRMDGTFLQTRPMEGRPHFGVEGALHEIEAFQGLALNGVRQVGWRTIEVRDPHTPFLLDALQAALSAACLNRHGFPPMIELHHDGRLLVVLPSDGFDAVVTAALGRVTGDLGVRIRISTNARGKVDLLDAPGTVADLRDSVVAMRTQGAGGRAARPARTPCASTARPSTPFCAQRASCRASQTWITMPASSCHSGPAQRATRTMSRPRTATPCCSVPCSAAPIRQPSLGIPDGSRARDRAASPTVRGGSPARLARLSRHVACRHAPRPAGRPRGWHDARGRGAARLPCSAQTGWSRCGWKDATGDQVSRALSTTPVCSCARRWRRTTAP